MQRTFLIFSLSCLLHLISFPTECIADLSFNIYKRLSFVLATLATVLAVSSSAVQHIPRLLKYTFRR
ncbi:hypothetical protein C8F04DRAFT_1091164 [Mycena alexandri]|uniref:Uncharacterized protein n=1 Tax=Mycena alexandri TaxID=1745969 RepID=A0AAD6T591_9AGAR|nr:hypothetical protein C8F04DRAFT_1091164 [Mycena alexandri]